MTDGTRKPVDEAKEGIKEGVRAVTGILAALKDAIEETIDDIKSSGDMDPSRVKKAAKETMHRAEGAFEDMKERVDFVTRKEHEALRAEVEALRIRVAALEGSAAATEGFKVDIE